MLSLLQKRQKRIGFGLGALIALGLVFAVVCPPITRDIRVVPILLFLVGQLVASAVAYHTGCGSGRREWAHTYSHVSRAYTNTHLAVDVPPHPFVGGMAEGYAFTGVVVLITAVGWTKLWE